MTTDKNVLPECDTSKPADQQGLFHKFDVRRVDGSDAPGGKHHGCRYFVLDVDHDAHATAALTAYAVACESTHPELARDLREKWGASHATPTIRNPLMVASEAGAVPVDAHAVIQEMIGVATTDEADSDWHPDHKTMVDQWQSRLQIALNLPAAPPSAPTLSMKCSEWEELSPTAQNTLLKITGAASVNGRQERAQAAQGIADTQLCQPSAPASAEMPNIQRFNPIAGLGMNPHSTGLYVRYEDHCAALAAAKPEGGSREYPTRRLAPASPAALLARCAPAQDAERERDALDGRDREHRAMGRALDRACLELPDLWEIRIDLEHNAGTVHLIDHDGEETMMEGGELFSDTINAAIDTARAQRTDKQPQACHQCHGTGLDGDVGNDGRAIDVPCVSCGGTGESLYREKCATGERCIHGCHKTDRCYGAVQRAAAQGDA